jgi:hypothetical protein
MIKGGNANGTLLRLRFGPSIPESSSLLRSGSEYLRREVREKILTSPYAKWPPLPIGEVILDAVSLQHYEGDRVSKQLSLFSLGHVC